MPRPLPQALRTALGRLRAAWRSVAVTLAVVLVSFVTLDLGPVVRGQVERVSGTWLDHGVHMGRLGIRLSTGRVVIDDLRIDGLDADDAPWLVARHVEVALTWSALLRRELLIDSIEMTDWKMVIETFADGRHNFPRITGPPGPPRTRPLPFVTTVPYTRLTGGTLEYRDHGTPWSIVSPGVELVLAKGRDYRGTLRLHDGRIDIKQYEPMAARLDAAFHLEGLKVVFDRIDLLTDGGVTAGTGVVQLDQWPEQTYQLRSRFDLPTMRAIFFARDRFALSGEGLFTGSFHMYKGGRNLSGDFRSTLAGINAHRLEELSGSLGWSATRFDVTAARTRYAGGGAEFTYSMAPLGDASRDTMATLDVRYRDVDLRTLSDQYALPGLRVAGRATGTTRLEWPLGRFAEYRAQGEVRSVAPPGVVTLGRALPADAAAQAKRRALMQGPFSPHTPLEPVPIAGELAFDLDGPRVRVGPSTVATPTMFLAFEGVTTWSGDESRVPFHVTSADWQESDRFLAGLMTAFGSRTAAVPMDGVGVFDGVLTGSFRRPHIEGRFDGDAMRAWDTDWGETEADVVVDNSYAFITRGIVRKDGSRLDIDGKFAIGYPRADGGEEIDARIRADQRPLVDFRQAFELQDYPVDGALSGEIHLYGRYEGPYGFGRLVLDRGTYYDEAFARGTASVRFEGAGARIDALEVTKAGGTITASAYVGWDGTYSFTADGRRLPVETINLFAFEGPPFLGMLEFTAGGSGTFDVPRYDARISVRDLFYGDEGVGDGSGRVAIRGNLTSFDFEAASPRLALSGSGRVADTETLDSDMTFRITDTSLDPYLRVLQPSFPGYTRMVGSGAVRVSGPLEVPSALQVRTTVDDLQVTLLDYVLRNRGQMQVRLDGETLRLDAVRLTGDRTELAVTGTVDTVAQALALRVTGEANLAVLQGFVPDVRSAGRAELTALVSGTAASPVFSGEAIVREGRLRTFAFPHALENLDGIVTFDATGVRLDGLHAQLAGGPVRFGGRIGMAAYQVSDLDVTVTGEQMRLRYPEGMRSVVDANVTLQGTATAPVIGGTVQVRAATWSPQLGSGANLFGGGSTTGASGPGVPGAMVSAGVPVALDIRLAVPSTLRIESDLARLVVGADLTLRGTLDRPLVFGRADIDRGEVRFEGRRYLVTRGSLDFANPERILPFFDVQAETRVRVPGQTYRVTLRVAGTTERLQPEFTSDPPLPAPDVLSLLLGDTRPAGDVEVASLRSPNQREQSLLQARATRALTGALSAEVGRVVEQTFGVDTFQVTPLLVDPYQQSSRLNVNPAARITIGKRLSERVFLTYVRSVSSSTRDEIVLLEYDQSDRLAWVLSQNEDRTYALEVRRRVVF